MVQNANIIYCFKCGGVVEVSPNFNTILISNINWCRCQKEAKSIPIGWECPRCHQIHSPFSLVCDCPPQVTIKNTNDTRT